MLPTKKKKKLLIIVPTYNEAGNIKPLINELQKVEELVAGWQFELLIVDDNSPDGTGKIIKNLQKKHQNLQLLEGKRKGLGAAYIRGFKYGLANGSYDAFIMMDADFSHDPQMIPTLVEALNQGADYVIGSRYTAGGLVADNWSLARGINSWAANVFAGLFVGTPGITDATAGFKAIRRSALEQIDLSQLKARGYVFQVDLLHQFSRRGFTIREVPITFTARKHGKSKLRVRDILEFLYVGYQLNPNSRARRIFRFGFVGLSGTVVNLAVLTLLVHLWNVPAIFAAAVAIELSIISNFFLNHIYTFRAFYSGKPVHKDTPGATLAKLLKFNLISLGGAAISLSVFSVLYAYFGVWYILADILGIIAAMAWNYWLSERVVWRVVDE
jgi:dolichol-phosphate mannosyltransferase